MQGPSPVLRGLMRGWGANSLENIRRSLRRCADRLVNVVSQKRAAIFEQVGTPLLR